MPHPDELIPAETVFEALDDALALAHEFDGADLNTKLGAFGLDADVIRAIVEERWKVYERRFARATRVELFAAACAEMLMCGVTLGKRRASS